MTRAIYETQGKAREYCELACNLYNGCGHGCVYCYNRVLCGKWGHPDFDNPQPRDGILESLERDAWRRQHGGETRPVFLCFTCDPYQPLNTEHQLTRKAIQILHKYELPVMILTKGGSRAERDFDLLTEKDWFGVTLTFSETFDSMKWEPRAELPNDRIASLREASHMAGIKTWVSLEPIIDPDQTIALIGATAAYVDHYKFGKLNHDINLTVDWKTAIPKIKRELDRYDCNYYIKTGTAKYLKERP